VADVAGLSTGTVDGLVHIIRGEDAKHNRYARIQRHLPDTVAGVPGYYIEVGRLTPDHRSKADYGIVPSGVGEGLGDDGQLEGPG
jgi:hypothetical protein